MHHSFYRRLRIIAAALLMVSGAVALGALAPADADAPPAPQNLRAETGDSLIKLTWEQVPGARFYLVRYRLAEKGTRFTRPVRVADTRLTYSGMAGRKSYIFRVSAADGDGNAGPEAILKVWLPRAARVQPPPNLTAQRGDGSVTLTWDTVPGAIAYQVTYRLAQSGSQLEPPITVTGNSHTYTGLQNGAKYIFRVTSLNNDRRPSSKAARRQVRLLTQPPTDLRAETGDGSVMLTWEPAPGAAAYRLTYQLDQTDQTGAPAEPPVRVKGHRHTYTDLENEARYIFQVFSLNLDREASDTAARVTVQLPIDYDDDDDHLIEIATLAQLDAIRTDRDGNGESDAASYAAAFPDAMAGMGCPDGDCAGYELVANLDFDTNGNGAADAGDAYWQGGQGWDPIGDDGQPFETVLDGGGYTIRNLYIKRQSDFVGLFAALGSGGKLRQVGLVGGAVSGNDYVGSLVGDNGGAISDSYTTGTVSGNSYVGGLVGRQNFLATISGSYATGNVIGENSNIGGLVGYNEISATVDGSYATGNVTGEGYNMGGLVGTNNYGTISGSYATGRVSDSSSSSIAVGGLVGTQHGISQLQSGVIIASYATGSVSGIGNVGGLVGHNSGGAISGSYATGRVSGIIHTGGLVGLSSNDTVSYSYWDTLTTGQTDSAGGVGKNSFELQSPTGYTSSYADWNLDLDGDGIADDPWDFGTTRQYPVLKYGGLSVADQRR